MVLFRLLIATHRPEVLRLRAVVATARKYRLLGRTGIVSSLDRQN